MSISFFVYEAIPNLVSFKSGDVQHTVSWEKFNKKYNPPFGKGIFSVNYEPERGLFHVVLTNNQLISGEQSLEINWVKANWQNFCDSIHEISDEFISVLLQKQIILGSTDWIVQRHQDQLFLNNQTNLSPDQFLELLTYRQQIRDVISSEDAADSVQWPARPFWLESVA
jgi:hypothetical protein